MTDDLPGFAPDRCRGRWGRRLMLLYRLSVIAADRAAAILPTWSGLLILGQSRVLALTALVPFLGTLILLNKFVVDVLTVSPEIIEKLTGYPLEKSQEIGDALTINQLLLVYFGLVLLGVSSVLFRLMCPAEVKRYPSLTAYVRDDQIVTPTNLELIIPQVARDYIWWASHPRGRRFVYPTMFGDLFDAIVSKAVSDIDWAVFMATPSIKEAVHELYDKQAIYPSGTGLPDIIPNLYGNDAPRPNRVASVLARAPWKYEDYHLDLMGRHVEEELRYVVLEKLKAQFRVDILTLNYQGRDHTRSIFRAIISISYAAGFGILFIPTLNTFISVVCWAFVP